MRATAPSHDSRSNFSSAESRCDFSPRIRARMLWRRSKRRRMSRSISQTVSRRGRRTGASSRPRASRASRGGRGPRESRESRESRASRGVRGPRESRASRASRNGREPRESLEWSVMLFPVGKMEGICKCLYVVWNNRGLAEICNKSVSQSSFLCACVLA